jgi:S-DNA-T family DNA segregation ATPase FtsK/SpoIIIE
MATRASMRRRTVRTDWRAVLRRALRRSSELAGAVLLFATMVFLGLALVSYRQTDPSASTAAGEEVLNWMGPVGAWISERALFLFGPVSVLLLPLLYVFARKLWRLVEEEDGLAEPSDQRWWWPICLLVFAMALICTVLSLVFTGPGGSLPASMGGISGLLGAKAITATVALLPEAARSWAIFGAALVCLIAGSVIAGRVFALDWAALLTLPRMLGRHRLALTDRSTSTLVRAPSGKDEAPLLPRAALPIGPARKAPEIVDPTSPARAARLAGTKRQKDLFEQFDLPSLDLLTDPPPNSAQKIDKLSLERNARLLETVLDDFNVKGEITAVRTGPVVTMYELEPAPGIKASRVIGLADDIARNMSAISARVSSIPGRTVMGIELPNADRQMVSFKEMVASEAFVNHKGLLPIILGKDIAGEPVIADLAAMPHLLVAGTTGSGK